MSRFLTLALVAGTFLSSAAFAATPSAGNAIDAFQKDSAVQQKISDLETQGYKTEGDATASAFQYSFGDEGYLVRYLVSIPLSKGTGPTDKTVTLVAAKVTQSVRKNKVSLVDTTALGEALRNLK